MKKVNKTLVAIAACALMISVTACSSNSGGNSSVSSDVSNSNNSSSVSSDVSNSNVGSDSNSSVSSDSNSSVSSDSNSSVSSDSNSNVSSDSSNVNSSSENSASSMHGIWSGTTYTSTFFGIKSEFDSEWTPLPDDYLLEQSGIADFSDSTLKSASVFYEMMVQKENGDNVNIVVQDLTASGADITEDDYIKGSVDALKQVYTAVDANAKIEQEQITFIGKTMSGVNLSYSIEEELINQMQVYLFKEDYVAVITFTTSGDETQPADIAAKFSAL